MAGPGGRGTCQKAPRIGPTPRHEVLAWAEGLLLVRGAVTDIDSVCEVVPEASGIVVIVADPEGRDDGVARPDLHRPADPAAFDVVEDEPFAGRRHLPAGMLGDPTASEPPDRRVASVHARSARTAGRCPVS